MILAGTSPSSADVADHYDELDWIYRVLWGEHVHHGLWRSGRETPAEAVEALSDHVWAKLDVAPGARLADIGCGYGATARRFAERHGVQIEGFTLSAEQARHAPPADGVRLHVRDWLANELDADSCDGAYAIESSEHFADKAAFFAEAARVVKPGGRLVVCAWLVDADASGWSIRHLLVPICREGRMPSLGATEDYRRLGEAAGFTVVACEDVSRQVRRTWSICARRLLRRMLSDPACLRFVLRARNRVFALSLPRLMLAYRIGALRYGILTFAKADHADG